MSLAKKMLKIGKAEEMEYNVILNTDKDRVKYIKRVEGVIRTSLEYKEYIRYLKEFIGLDSCVFFQNVTSNSTKGNRSKVHIEIHHEPLTLYDITNTVYQKYMDTGEPINDLVIAEEVMKLHYENKVGLVPVSKTAHEMVHNSSKLFVPLTMCYGEYSKFFEEYEEWIDDSLYEKLQLKQEMTEKITPETFDAICREFTYLDVEGVEDVKRMTLENALGVA